MIDFNDVVVWVRVEVAECSVGAGGMSNENGKFSVYVSWLKIRNKNNLRNILLFLFWYFEFYFLIMFVCILPTYF